MEEYQNLFDKLVVPLPLLLKQVLEETFINRLTPWIKVEVECWELVALAQMMKLPQRVENRKNHVKRGKFKGESRRYVSIQLFE